MIFGTVSIVGNDMDILICIH